MRPRRAEELRQPYFSDQIDAATFALVVALLALTVADGAVTLLLLEAGCEEANPAMRYLIQRGPTHFLLGKYLLTSAGLPVLLVFRNFFLFRTRFRVGYLIPLFVGLYLVLLGYQFHLMNHDGQQAPRESLRDSIGEESVGRG
jgi:hypothetical protein